MKDQLEPTATTIADLVHSPSVDYQSDRPDINGLRAFIDDIADSYPAGSRCDSHGTIVHHMGSVDPTGLGPRIG